VGGFLVAAVTSPPDPFSQVRWFAVLLVVGGVAGGWLSLAGGYDRIGAVPPNGFDVLGGAVLGFVPGAIAMALVPASRALVSLGPVRFDPAGLPFLAIFVPVYVWGALYGGAYRTRQALFGSDESEAAPDGRTE